MQEFFDRYTVALSKHTLIVVQPYFCSPMKTCNYTLFLDEHKFFLASVPLEINIRLNRCIETRHSCSLIVSCQQRYPWWNQYPLCVFTGTGTNNLDTIQSTRQPTKVTLKYLVIHLQNSLQRSNMDKLATRDKYRPWVQKFLELPSSGSQSGHQKNQKRLSTHFLCELYISQPQNS